MAKLTVLTFGWEFPPHISGGLGTACYGLTKSLIRRGTEVLFVVPKVHGNEEIPLISASEVFVPYAGEQPKKKSGGPVPSPERVGARRVSGVPATRVISVSSTIQPYTSTERPPAEGLQAWNYEFRKRDVVNIKGVVDKAAEVKYHFSGGYGVNLFEEVARYGEVGGSLGREHRFDVIHAHDWLTFPAGIAAKKASGKPLVVHIHATEYDRAGTRNVDQKVFKIEKDGMDAADKIVAVSEWTKRILVSAYGVKEEKIAVVHNGVIGRKRTCAIKPARLGKHMVTFLGRVTYQKGPQYFVEAARKVIEKFPATHFVMAGSGDLLPAILERVAALKLSAHFHFTGFLRGQQVDQVWSVTDVYVMPSVSEPFGITPLEAIQSGVPVILSRQSGVSEVMPHAIKADFWDIDSLAGAICSVLRHKSLAETLRRHSKQSVKEITWDNAARNVNKIYHELSSNAS